MTSLPTFEPTAGTKLDVTALVRDVEDLLATEIFSAQESDGPLFRAAFVWLILNVNELLQEADRRGQRIVDVPESTDDITDLVARARYAIVHAAGGAKQRAVAQAQPRSRVLVGGPSGHVDDIAVDLGKVRVLIRRDVVRPFEAVRGVLLPG